MEKRTADVSDAAKSKVVLSEPSPFVVAFDGMSSSKMSFFTRLKSS